MSLISPSIAIIAKYRQELLINANKNKSNGETGHKITLNDFCQYFRSLASEETSFENPGVEELLQNFDNSDNGNDSSYSELDEPISQEGANFPRGN